MCSGAGRAGDAEILRRAQVRIEGALGERDAGFAENLKAKEALLVEAEAIDTSDLNIHQLSNKISDGFSIENARRLQVTVMSFGFKYGLPSDADQVADARFLPNPFWQEDLRPFTGEDAAVSEYVLAQEGAEEFVTNYIAALKPVLAGYLRENKRYATIAIGCTGGKHRSVAISRRIASELEKLTDVSVNIKHRDLGKE